MKKKKIVSRISGYELHHRILSFVAVMLLTIAVVRLFVFIHNPNPIFLNFELHHFDYGLLLLLITALLLLFGKKNDGTYLLLSGIAFGLILDDLWFIRSNLLDPGINEVQIYNSTFLSVVVLSILIILVILLIDHFRGPKKNRRNHLVR
ncbi:hypothetical protein J4210_03205 [Candidatus Woesearchaeota archaeon]|nr:hypothetical protein [Candidatus Woesearchaeota archaeon]